MERTNKRNGNTNHQRKGKTMQKITWTATDDGNQHIATNANGFEIGRVRIKLAKSDLAVLGVSANGMAKMFALIHHAKDWIEDLYSDVADAIENA